MVILYHRSDKSEKAFLRFFAVAIFGTFCSLAPVEMKILFCYHQIIKVSVFFKLSADIQFMPIINLDLGPDFGNFVLDDQACFSTRLSCAFSSKVKESGTKFVENMPKGSFYHRI